MMNTNVNLFDDIQSVCREYRNQLKQQTAPSISEFLGRVDESAVPMLFQNLLHIDIEYRRRRGEQPTSNEYVERFPDLARLIRQAFFESTMMTRDFASDTPDQHDTVEFAVPAARRIGDYELLGELGRGGFGVVYEARHLQRGDVVALKTLPTSVAGPQDTLRDAERLHRFKREFRALTDISHPCLVELHSLEFDGDQWFFTMDVVRGTDFLSYVQPYGKLDTAKLRGALAQLVSGILSLHGNYVIHRDLKPSNVMIEEDGRVVLLDFGLALEQQPTSIMETTDGVAGTPAYMSPEQAKGGSITPACDWYALGVMLYESLSGELPFRGSPSQILRDKQQQSPPPLPSDRQLPQDLCELCIRLLATAATDRPSPAEVAQVVSSVEPLSADSCEGEEAILIGRESQLSRLDEALRRFDGDGNPVAVFVDGRSGEGKTSLCSTFLDQVRRRTEYAVLSGRCYDRESVPFKALDTAIDAICGYLNGMTSPEVSAVLPRDVAILRHVFPVFGRVKEIRSTGSVAIGQIEEQEVRNRAYMALRDLIGRLSDQRPLVLFIDDLQWGDTDSAEVLLQTLRGPTAPRVFFLGTYRTDEAEDSRFLQAWKKTRQQQQIQVETCSISVGPLSPNQCTDLMAEMLHVDASSIRQRAQEFCEQTGGNAFLFTELVGCFDPHSDSFRQVPVHQLIEEKLSRLPNEATAILQMVCISGQSLNAAEVGGATKCAVAMATLSRMRSERLIRFVGETTDCIIDTYHDRIRETVLQEMDVAVAASEHARLAEAIEQIDGGLTEQQLIAIEQGKFDLGNDVAIPRMFDLAFHFTAAGKSRRALAYNILAADQARKQFSLESVVSHYQSFCELFDAKTEGSNGVSRAARYQVHLRLGDALRLLGRYAAAESVFTKAHELAADDLQRGAVEALNAEAIQQSGQFKNSAERYAASLQKLGVSVPESKLSIAVGLAVQTLIQAWHSVRGYPRPGSVPPTQAQALATQMLAGLEMAVWFRNLPMVLWVSLKLLNHAEKFSETRDLVEARHFHGVFCMVMKLDRRGQHYLELAKASIHEEDYMARMKVYFHECVGHYCRCRFERSQQAAAQGMELLDRSGDAWRGLLFKLHYLLSDVRIGNLQTSLNTAKEAFAESVRLGDANTAHDYINIVAVLTNGHFPFEEMNAALTPIPDNIQATNQLMQAEARWHLAHGRWPEAYDSAVQAYQLIMSNVVINHITTCNFPLLLEAARRLSVALEPDDPLAAKRLLKLARRRASWAIRITSGGPDYPATLREAGKIDILLGRPRVALRRLAASRQEAERTGMRYEQALTTHAEAQYLHQQGKITKDELDRHDRNVSKYST